MPICCDALDCDGRFAAGLIAGADEVPGLKTEAGFQKGSAANSDRLVGHLRASQQRRRLRHRTSWRGLPEADRRDKTDRPRDLLPRGQGEHPGVPPPRGG